MSKMRIGFLKSKNVAGSGLIILLMMATELVFAVKLNAGDVEKAGITDADTALFNSLNCLKWEQVFFDSGTVNWHESWMLDGIHANVKNTPEGMIFSAGPVPYNDSSHAVLWTKDSFSGNLKVEYDFMRLDSAMHFVNIIYLMATGSGEGPYARDISKWADRRKVAAMKEYYNHMSLYHISYAAFSNQNADPENDYLRARRYVPETAKGLSGTALIPDYNHTGMFKTGKIYKITVILYGNDLLMNISGADKTFLCHWNISEFPRLNSGRIGLRHMCTRVARYKNIRVSKIDE